MGQRSWFAPGRNFGYELGEKRDKQRGVTARAAERTGRHARSACLIYSYLNLEHEIVSVRNGAGLRVVDRVATNAYATLLETRTGAYEGSKRSEDDGPASVAGCLKGCDL